MACRNRQLGLILLKEAKQASKSKFKLWIDSFPSEVQTLINWSQKELQQLQMDDTPAERDFLTQVVLLDLSCYVIDQHIVLQKTDYF